MKSSSRYLVSFALKLLLILVILEITFRFLPATNVPCETFDEKHDLFRFNTGELRQGLYTYGSFAEIKARWHVNNMGWLSAIDYRYNAQPLVAIIGDSYIESLCMEPDRNMTARLRNHLRGTYDVYSFGISAASLNSYLHISRYVRQNFHPEILVFNIVDGDILDSLEPQRDKYFSYGHGGVIENKVPCESSTKPNSINYLYRKSALLRYLRLNNGFLGKAPVKLATIKEETLTNEKLYHYRQISSYTFAKIRQENPGCTVIIVIDAPRNDIYLGQTDKVELNYREVIAENARKNGFIVVDMAEPMTRLFAANGRMFNFKNNYHWNEYGNQVVADEIFTKVFKQKGREQAAR